MDFLLIAIPLAVVVIAVIVVAKNIASHSFKCNRCSQEFYINWYQVIITEHSDDDYKLLCPFCGTKDWCTRLPKN